jgi:hypothetical protein
LVRAIQRRLRGCFYEYVERGRSDSAHQQGMAHDRSSHAESKDPNFITQGLSGFKTRSPRLYQYRCCTLCQFEMTLGHVRAWALTFQRRPCGCFYEYVDRVQSDSPHAGGCSIYCLLVSVRKVAFATRMSRPWSVRIVWVEVIAVKTPVWPAISRFSPTASILRV